MADQVVLLTPAGVGAIAVVRVMGEGVEGFLRECFSRQTPIGRCVHGELRDGGRVLDDAVVVRGDGFADLNLHGGAWVVQSAMELAWKRGFVTTDDPLAGVDGETLLEREIAAALPLARSQQAIEALLAQRAAWEQIADDQWQRMLGDTSLWRLLHPPRVAIVGVANVGKSTLANQLYAQQRSITADLPGTTRDWVGELANIDGLVAMLVDTPGWRSGGDALEEQAIARSRGVVEQAEAVVLVLDPTQWREPQSELARRWRDAILVLNKNDRIARWQWDGDERRGIGLVATDGRGVDALRGAIRRHFGCERFEPDRARWWTPRQRELVRQRAAGATAR